MAKKVKKIARNAVASVAGQYIGAENVKMARVAINSVAKTIRPKPTILGLCASKYLLAYLQPFQVDGVCIPVPPSTPTVKQRTYVRGVANIGTNGFGFIAVAPTLCNDRPCIYSSTSSFTPIVTSSPVSDLTFAAQSGGGALYPALTYLPTGVSFSILNSGSGTDPLNTSVEGRIVSACINVQYSGKAVDQQGLIVGWNSLQSVSVVGDTHTSATNPNGYSLSDLMSQPTADVEMNKSRICLPIFPSDTRPDDFSDYGGSSDRHAFPYSEEVTYQDSSGAKTGAPVAVIAFTGTASSTMYYEYVQHVEYKGTFFAPNRYTQSEVDFVGYTIVKDIISKARFMTSSTNGKSFDQCIKMVMNELNIKIGREYRTI